MKRHTGLYFFTLCLSALSSDKSIANLYPTLLSDSVRVKMTNEPVVGGLRRAWELGLAAASQIGDVAMSWAGYLASGIATAIRTVIRAAEAHPKTAAAIGGGILAVVAAPVALAAAGFGSAGVAAGSAAAAWQVRAQELLA